MEPETAPLLSNINRGNSGIGSSQFGRIMSHILVPSILLIVAGLEIIGPFLGSHFTIKTESLKIHDFNQQELPIANLEVHVAADGLNFLGPEAPPASYVRYTKDSNPVFGGPFQGFNEYLVGVEYIVYAWRAIDSFGIISGSLMALALIIQLIFREAPTTMAFKSDQKLKDNWKGALPIWIALVGVLLGITRVFASSSFIQSIAAQVALYAVSLKSSAPVWARFLDDLNNPKPRTYSLDVMREIGAWAAKDGISWGFPTYFILISLVLKIILIGTVFYLDTRVARLRLSLGSDSNPQLVSTMRQEMKRLPKHCRILPIWMSISSLGTAITFSKIFGRITFNRGRALNRLLWTSSDQLDGYILDDFISTYTNSVWLNPPKVVDVAVLLWVPIALIVIIGSINRLDGSSKLIELLSYGYWLRLISILFTTLPTPTTPFQVPNCYREERMTLWEMVTEVEFCNDMVYSGHVTLAAIPCSILVLMIIYAPFERKFASIAGIATLGILSAIFVVIGRFHYTTDVIVSIVVCSCLVLIHAPAWKILFSYRRLQLKSGSVSGVGKCVGQLEATNTAIEVAMKLSKIDYDHTNWTTIEKKQNQIREQLEKLQYSSMLE